MRAALLLVVLAACGIEHLPPVVLVRHGVSPQPVHRVILLPSECATQACKGLDAIVASELAFRGVDVVDLDRIAAVERTRTEVAVTTTTTVDGKTATGASHTVEVHGPLLSDVDAWTMRDQLAKMGIDGVVRVRTASIESTPRKMLAMVRIARMNDASLVWSSACQVELHATTTEQEGADLALHCALKGALP